ncbi:TolC family protein [uncultured Duncaniella sp.]|uniref:TolC family protein n=1 Tax=uncultured Duncaniella sp. TaxID=2768039 RepID=UPI00272D2727|nr:TolC family protein [uncultured Duncaniella sp.]
MNRLHIFSTLTLLLPLLSGCGLYSGYERPAIGYDAEHMCLPDSVCSPLAAMSWRELFTDEYLSAWIDSGLNSNTDLRIAALKVDEARATLSASRLAFLPSVSLSADGSVGSGSADRFSIGPSASWEIDAFGKQRNLKMGAEASWFASQAYRQAVQSQLVATIAEGYYTLLMLDEQLSISERTLTTWDENIRVLQALKRAGRTNEAAVLQARANRMRVESSTLTLRNQIAEQENAIRSLLLDPDADMARGSLREQSFPESLSAGIPIDLLSNRPDVREAEYRLQKSFYDINVARAAFYPSITLSGNAGWTTSSGSVGNPSSWIANALGSVVVPIFNRGTNKANLDIARARYEENLLDFQQKLLDAGMEVNNALIAWQTANGRLALDRKQIVALKGAVHNTRLLMRNTTTNYLEVLTAQQRLLEAELSEASDRFDVIRSVISLYHALGGGR